MVFGAYPIRHRMDVILEKPLLEEGSPSEASEYLEYASGSFPRYWSGRKQQRGYCISFAAFLGVGICTIILVVQSVLLWQLWDRPVGPEVLGEVNGLVPPVDTKPIIFRPDPTFDPLNASDPGWGRIMPVGGGFVPIRDWQGKALTEPIRTHGKDLYNVAVFHQLHCLHMLAEEFGNLIAERDMTGGGSKKAGHGSHQTGAGSADKDDMMWHIRHCFEYIKTSLTCCSDTTLEGQNPNTDLPATDGFGAQHMCRDFDAVFDWAESNRASNQAGYPH